MLSFRSINNSHSLYQSPLIYSGFPIYVKHSSSLMFCIRFSDNGTYQAIHEGISHPEKRRIIPIEEKIYFQYESEIFNLPIHSRVSYHGRSPESMDIEFYQGVDEEKGPLTTFWESLPSYRDLLMIPVYALGTYFFSYRLLMLIGRLLSRSQSKTAKSGSKICRSCSKENEKTAVFCILCGSVV